MRISQICPSLLVVALAACGGSDTAERADGAAAGEFVVDPATAASIRGVVHFDGAAPAPEPIDMSSEPDCAEKHSSQPTRRPIAVNDNATLRNVFVYVREGLPDERFAHAPGPKVMDQDGCVYLPHVLAVQTGQEMIFRNSDGLLHNINVQARTNRAFNTSQPVNMDTRRTFSQPEVMIPVRCDVHGWMDAYIAVVDHPFYAVTAEDGSYEITGLPPGTYTVETWHERLGTQTSEVTVAAQESQTAEFRYSAGMAENAVVPLGAPIDPHGDHGTAHRHVSSAATQTSSTALAARAAERK